MNLSATFKHCTDDASLFHELAELLDLFIAALNTLEQFLQNLHSHELMILPMESRRDNLSHQAARVSFFAVLDRVIQVFLWDLRHLPDARADKELTLFSAGKVCAHSDMFNLGWRVW